MRRGRLTRKLEFQPGSISMTSNPVEPTAYQFWRFSTGHITLHDAKLLLDWPCLVVYAHEYGRTVLVPQDELNDAMAEIAERGRSAALRSLLLLDNSRDIQMIRFDREGDLVAVRQAVVHSTANRQERKKPHRIGRACGWSSCGCYAAGFRRRRHQEPAPKHMP
ncbi:MAG: hypothetical protein RIC55_26790, partial [Pirellulaceae bacterium]